MMDLDGRCLRIQGRCDGSLSAQFKLRSRRRSSGWAPQTKLKFLVMDTQWTVEDREKLHLRLSVNLGDLSRLLPTWWIDIGHTG